MTDPYEYEQSQLGSLIVHHCRGVAELRHGRRGAKETKTVRNVIKMATGDGIGVPKDASR